MECDRAKRERAVARNNNHNTRTRYSRAREKCKLIFDKCKKSSWQAYLTSNNSKILINSIWNKVKRLSKKFAISPSTVLNHNNTSVTDTGKVAEVLGEFLHLSVTQPEITMNSQGTKQGWSATRWTWKTTMTYLGGKNLTVLCAI